MGYIFMKKCFKCGCEKPISEFYKHKAMSDGHLNKCKCCAKKDVKKNRDKRSDYYKEYDAWRFQEQPQVKDRQRRYQKTKSGKESMRRARDIWKAANPEKRAAHVILGAAVKNGKVNKPKVCTRCNQFTPSRNLHGHHDDYSKPLDVVWLCVYCHVKEHKGDNNGK